MKRHLSGIILLLCLVMPSVGLFMHLHIKRARVRRVVKHEIMAHADREDLVLLKFSSNDLSEKIKWTKTDEFEYQGYLYDVIEKLEKNDSTYMWCWWDFEETKLNKQLENQLAFLFSNDVQNKNDRGKVIKIFKSLFLPDQSPPEFTPIVVNNPTTYTFGLTEFVSQPISPPPKFA